MAKLIKIVAILLIVLPALIAASACKLSVTSTLSDTNGRYNIYTGTINNIGSASASNVLVTPSTDLRSVSGLNDVKNSDGYSLTNAQVNRGGIAAGSSYSFTYTVSKGENVRWSSSCTDGATTGTSTTVPTAKATSAPSTKTPTTTKAPATKGPTSAPATKAPTSAPSTKSPTTTKAPTSAPTAKATSAPATKAATTTKAPTSSPATKAPTTTTKVITQAPSSGGRKCPSGTWWKPAPQTTYQWQLTGSIDTSFDVQMYDIDLFDNTAATIQTLHSQGRVVICYFSTQYENWRPDAASFTSAVLGSNLDDWAGERFVDIRSTVVRNVINARLDLAVSKGCDGVEPDNVDSYSSSSGFPLTAANQLDFNRYIATQAHARGLSVGLKNDLDQATALEPAFDWALNEQCKEYSECSYLNIFITKGKAVFNTEYSGSGASVCPSMVTSKFSSLVKSLDLGAAIKAQCCTYQSNGCADAPYQCVSSSSSRTLEEEQEEQTVFAVKSLETKELTTQEPIMASSATTTSFASIALVVVAAVAALNL